MARAKKATKTLTDEQLKTKVTIAAMERAIEVLNDQLPANCDDVRPGTYPLALTIDITGDMVKGEAYRNDDKQGPSFTDKELLHALLYGMSTTEVEEKVHEAVENILHARTNVGAKATMAKAEELLGGVVTAYCKTRGQWEIKPGKLNRGPTTGKPRVSVDGTIAINETDLGVKLTIEADAPSTRKSKKGKGSKKAA